jgi:hypothetical protein
MKGVDLTLVSDEYGRFGDQFGVSAIPHMILVGRDGKIASVHVGYSEDNISTIVDEINSLWRTTADPAVGRTLGSSDAAPSSENPTTIVGAASAGSVIGH